MTGLSGAGKTTISIKTVELLEKHGLKVLTLDGDVVRTKLHKHLGFSPGDIRENNRLVALLCQELSSRFDVILVPIISPFRDSRKSARSLLGEAFTEVYIKASLTEVMKRDPKGHYKAVRQGTLTGFIGIDDQVPYEPPESADLILDTEAQGQEECAKELAELLIGKVAIR